jgi:hypothetical protein
MRVYDKHLPFETLEPLHPEALRRATQLDRRHKVTGTEGDNSSTRVHMLMEEIRSKPA